MITGSHNPPPYNGFKIMVGGKPFCGEDIQSLFELFSSGTFPEKEGATVKRIDFSDQYVDFLIQDFKEHYGNSSLKIAWDTGNGAAGDVVAKLLRQLPGEHYLINEEIDGNFPAHHPDPTEPKNMIQLCELVQKEGCDFGIGFDGDGDRIGVIDPQGRLLWGDQLLGIFAEEGSVTYPGSPVLVADIKSSPQLLKSIAHKGGKPLLCKTGHSHIKRKMKELASPLGGEMSGHIMFADRYFGFDDALYAAIRLVGIFSLSDFTFEAWLNQQPETVKTKEIHVPSEEKFQDIERLKAILQNENKEFCDIDGIRLEEDFGWWLIRASNTQEIIVLRVEADTQEQFDVLAAQVEQYLQMIGLTVTIQAETALDLSAGLEKAA